MSVVVLMDIDGTLLDTAGAGRTAMEKAFEELAGDPEALRRFRFAGMTDLAIVGGGLEGAGLEASAALVEAVLQRYVELLPAALQERTAGYTVHPGVEPLCARLGDHPGVAFGLGTGNIEAGARAKLAPADLNRWFPFGGFGSDHLLRPEVLEAGVRRGAAHLGQPRTEVQIVVVGDTPKDITAAHAVGGRCVAVATGGFTADELEGADLVVSDLTDEAVVQEILRVLG